MAANLPHELAKFHKNCRLLRRILRETKKSFTEIKASGQFEEGHCGNIQFSAEEEDEITSVTDRPPCIIVFGQSRWAKACVINELFNQPILPMIVERKNSDIPSWRMVKFKYGQCNQISLALPNSYELVEKLEAYEQPWRTIPRGDLELKNDVVEDPAHGTAVLEIKLKHPLLKDGAEVVMSPCNQTATVKEVYDDTVDVVIPIVIYAIGEDNLSVKDMRELAELRVINSDLPVFFIRTLNPPSNDLTESEQHAVVQSSCQAQRQRWPTQRPSHKINVPSLFSNASSSSSAPTFNLNLSKPPKHRNDRTSSMNLFQQLHDLGYLTVLSHNHRVRHRSDPYVVESELIDNFENFASILLFVRHILQSYLIKASSTLNAAHSKCLRMFILTAFDMARDMLITPRRIEYAKDKESELYESLLNIANKKQDEIRDLIIETISSMREELLQASRDHEFQGVEIKQSDELMSARDLKICTGEIQDLVLGRLNSAVARKLIGSVNYLRESFVGTLHRCLNSLEISCKDAGESPQATNALKQILNAAYHVEVTVRTSSSLIRVLWEKMKQLVQAMPWRTPPRINEEWKTRVASDMISSLSESRLAKSICSQFRDRLKISHEQFSASLKQLELIHSGRLERTEEQRLKVRKVHAPRLARYALESTSLRDQILFGMPQMGREIGRGQYGVVFACETWAGYSPCAIKSVVPPDDKHWNDLALEFYYTRSIPEHDRLVSLKGSVIDYSYGGGTSPAVLLVMERLQKDLYSAIKTGLDWNSRLQVALDVIQGIRYLHGQGLVHRDIKLKNVLLDKKNRGKITDMGFCKPEAMMSGSIVGTPIHMAPELFTGRYDNSVDVYAFGILFWYICAGHVRLPYVFEQCQNKDQLWSCVRKGARPERLTQFDSECWQLMEQCWAGDPVKRPLLGNVEPRLVKIIERYQLNEPQSLNSASRRESDVESLSTSPFIGIPYYDT